MLAISALCAWDKPPKCSVYTAVDSWTLLRLSALQYAFGFRQHLRGYSSWLRSSESTSQPAALDPAATFRDGHTDCHGGLPERNRAILPVQQYVV